VGQRKVAAQVKKQYPDVQVERKELGAQGELGGYIRAKKVARHLTRFRGDGITIEVPYERLDRIKGPHQVGGGWEMRIQFTAQPEEETS
jgi:hypothetical protein